MIRQQVSNGQNMLPHIYLIRHGETEWSLFGQHTGRTDFPLTARGEDEARKLGQRLHDIEFVHVLTNARAEHLTWPSWAGQPRSNRT